ncbi:MAG: hypothetical protein AAF358_23525 [Pseudomonadota bacterium]
MLTTLLLGLSLTAASCGQPSDATVTPSCSPLEEQWAAVRQTWQSLDAALKEPEVQAKLAIDTRWQSQFTQVLLRYRSFAAARREAPPVEPLLGELLQSSPQQLAPRMLRFHRCGDARPHQEAYAAQAACRADQADLLREHHPNNAVGYLLLAELAWEKGDLLEATRLLEAASQATELDVGERPAMIALSETIDRFAESAMLPDQLVDGTPFPDPALSQKLGALYWSAGIVQQRFPDPLGGLTHRCQSTSEPTMQSPCLAFARALRLPGVDRLAVMRSLAIEGSVYTKRGEDSRAARLSQQRIKVQQLHPETSYKQFLELPDPLATLRELILRGEAYARLTTGPTLIETVEAIIEPNLEMPEDCTPGVSVNDDSACLSFDVYSSEADVVDEFLQRQAHAPATLSRWAEHPDPGVQTLSAYHLNLQEHLAGLPKQKSMAALKTVITRYPDAWLPRRIMLQRCITEKHWGCVEESALYLTALEPDNAFALTQLAALAVQQKDKDSARAWLELAGKANRYDRGLGGVAYEFFHGYQKGLTGPAVDPLDLRSSSILGMSLSLALTLSGLEKELLNSCKDDGALDAPTCLEAARIMQLPGGDFFSVQYALALERRAYEAAGDEAGIAQTEKKRAQLRALMGTQNADWIMQPENSETYVELLRQHGEIGTTRIIGEFAQRP